MFCVIKGDLILYFLFRLNWPRIGFCNPIYKNELFFLPKLTFQHHLAQDMYGLLFTKMNIF